VGLAGDAFDARIVRKLVSTALGADSHVRSLKKILPAALSWIYANLEPWHYLSFLRTRNVMEISKSAGVRALEPEKIEALITLIEEDLGYQLHRAVQGVKCELSRYPSAEFCFRDGSLNLHISVTRSDFEAWIADGMGLPRATTHCRLNYQRRYRMVYPCWPHTPGPSPWTGSLTRM
jgi:hypothetical chaperone protein